MILRYLKSGLRWAVRKALQGAAWLGALMLLMLQAAPMEVRENWWFGLLNLTFPFLWLVGIAVALLARKRRQRCLWRIWVAALFLGLFRWPCLIHWHPLRHGNLRVVSMNCNYFYADRKGPVAANIGSVFALLQRLRPDILCLQDSSTDSAEHNDLFRNFLKQQLGLAYFMEGENSDAIYARFGWSRFEYEKFPESENSLAYVDLRLPRGNLRVFNLHLESYAVKPTQSPREVLRRLRRGMNAHVEQAGRVGDLLETSPGAVLLCGDCNDVPGSYTYQTFAAHLSDGFVRAGQGWGFTYAGPLPALRIDYIFGKGLEFRTYRVLKGPAFLDHKLVYAELAY